MLSVDEAGGDGAEKRDPAGPARQDRHGHKRVRGSHLAVALIAGALCGTPAPAEAQVLQWVIWSATLTVDKESQYYGCDSRLGPAQRRGSPPPTAS